MELNTIPKTGDYGTGVDRHNDNYQKIGLKLETLENMSLNEKGYFETLTALEAKYPTPQSGWQAYVKDAGSSTGYYVANVNSSGDWVVTGAEAPPVGVDLTAYAKNGGSEKTVKDVEDEIVQLAVEKTDSGTLFTVKGAAVRMTGEVEGTIEGIDSTEFIPISRNSVLRGRGWSGGTGTNVAAIAFYDENKQFISALRNDSGYFDYEFQSSEIPDGAVYVRSTENSNRGEGFIIISTLSYVSDLNKRIEKVDDEISQLAVEKTDIGTLFTVKGAAVRMTGAVIGTVVEGIDSTEFIPITRNSVLKGRGWSGGTGTNVAAIAFYDENKQFISALRNDSNYFDYEFQSSEIPDGAAYVRGTENSNRGEGFITISTLSYVSDLDKRIETKIGMSELNQKVNSVSDLLLKDGTMISPIETIPGQYINTAGDVKSNASMSTLKFEYDPSKRYSSMPKYTAGINGIIIFHYYDENNERIGTEGLVSSGVVQDFNGVLNPSEGTSYFILNKQTSQQADVYGSGEYYKISDLDKRIDEIDGKIGPISGKRMKVIFNGDNFYVRTKYDATHDVITTYIVSPNGNLTPNETYKGLSTATDNEIISAGYIHLLYDSTGPVWMPEYWYLGAQHGYEICRIICTHDKTEGDIGSIWKDNLDREFTLGKVEGTSLYFLPEITIGTPEGKDTRSWKVSTDSSAITEITHVSGATHTTSITAISSKPRYSYKPIQKSLSKKFLADGKEITIFDQPIYCDGFVATETIQVVNPVKVTQWFPELIHEASDWEMFNIVQSFIITGLSTTVNTVLNVKYPLNFTHYGANQARTLVPITGYDSYAIIPKTVPQNFAGSLTDFTKEFNTSDYSNNSNITFYRHPDYVKDVNDMPDRIITYLKNSSGIYDLGFASGLSLTRGITTKERRLEYVPEGTEYCNQALLFSPSNRNKFYVRAIEGDAYSDRLLPRGVYEINYYMSYFDPGAQDNKVYWYKDGNRYVIYVHSENGQLNTEILLPDEMEGLTVEIVEKTDGAILLTEVIQNGKLYASFDNAANYIVLATI